LAHFQPFSTGEPIKSRFQVVPALDPNAFIFSRTVVAPSAVNQFVLGDEELFCPEVECVAHDVTKEAELG
jgi:hypothetical protein